MSDSALILTKPLAHGILYIGEILHHFGLKETFSFIFGVAPPTPLYNIALRRRAPKNLGAAGEMVHHPGSLDTSRLNIIKGEGAGGEEESRCEYLSYGAHLVRRRWCTISPMYR